MAMLTFICDGCSQPMRLAVVNGKIKVEPCDHCIDRAVDDAVEATIKKMEKEHMKKSYVVIAYRYGTNENVFPIGVFSGPKEAATQATWHHTWRGGKYKHRIFEFVHGVVFDDYCSQSNVPFVEDENE